MKKTLLIAGVAGFWACVSIADTQWKGTAGNAWNEPSNWTNGSPGINRGQPTWFVGDSSLQHTQFLFGMASSAQGIGYGPCKGGGGFVVGEGGAPAVLQLRAGGPIGGIINNDTNAQTFNVPIVLIGPNTLSGKTAAQMFNAARGDLIFSGKYAANRSTIANNGGELTVDGAFNTTIGLPRGRGDIAGPGGLTKKGSGTLTLGGTNDNTYLGDTLLYDGTLVANKTNAFGSGGLTLFGGTFKPNGYSHTFTVRLGLQGAATIDLGSGAKNELSFGESAEFYWPEGATLKIVNWKAHPATLRFGTNAAALNPAQLKAIVFPDLPGSHATIDAEGFVTPGK
jgi:autotransporter-associated beta strand protein